MNKPPKIPKNLNLYLIHTVFWGLLLGVALPHATKIPLMGDELLTYLLGTLPPKQLLAALGAGADSHGPLYHLLNHFWLSLPHNPQSIELWGRLPSIALWGASGSLLLNILHKRLGGPLSLALCTTLLLWPESLRHIPELRSYGWMMFLVSLQLFLLEKLQGKQTPQLLISLTLCSAASSLSHPMATYYSGAMLLGYTLTTHQLKPLLAWSTGLLALVPWALHLLAQSQATLDPSVRWAHPPTLDILWRFAQPSMPLAFTTLLILTLSPPFKPYQLTQTPPLWRNIGLCMMGASLGLWTLSQATNPLFTERYLLPLRVGWILICGHLLIQKNIQTKIPQIAALTATLLIGTALLQTDPPSRSTTGGFWTLNNPWNDIGLGDKTHLKEPLPIACESSTIYLPRKFYTKNAQNYTLLLHPAPQGVEKMDRNMSQALAQFDKRQKVEPLQEFLKKNKRFYLLNEKHATTDKHIPPSYQRTILYSSQNHGGDDSLSLELFEENP